MPISIKVGSLKYKDPTTGQYESFDVVGETITYDAEAYARGTRQGNPITSIAQHPAYQNNAKYYAQQAAHSAQVAQGAADGSITELRDAISIIQNTLAAKVDRITLSGTRIEFFSGSSQLGYCELADNSISYNKLAASVRHAIDKMNIAMTTDVYDPYGYGTGNNPIDPYTYSDNRNAILKNEVVNTDSYIVDGTSYSGIRAAFEGILANARNYGDSILTRTYTIDNTQYNGLVAALDGVLYKAKTYTEDQDNAFVNTRGFSVDGTTYTGLIAALEGVLTKANDHSNQILTRNYSIDGDSYTGLVSAIAGILNKARDYTDDELINYIPYSIVFVNQLPTIGADRTFYLIEKQNNIYEKWWYIDDGTGNNTKMWDQFGGGSSTKVVTALPPAGAADPNIDYILKTSAGCMYYKWINNKWEIVAGSLASVVDELPSSSEGNEYTDYYLENDGNYIHYRFKDGEFIQVGSAEDGYSTEEIDSMISTLTGKVNTNSEKITSATQRVSALTTRLGNLQQIVDDLDIANYDYKATYQTEELDGQETENVFRLYKIPMGGDIQDEDAQVVSQFVIQGGGGGGGGTAASTLSVRRITPSPYVVTKNDQILLQFEYSSTNSDNEDVPGTYSWKIGNRTIASGPCIKGVNTFDITEYITSIGTTRVTLQVSDEGNSSTTKSYTIQKVDLYIESAFNDKSYAALNTPIRFTYEPHGNVLKTIHFKLDGVETTENTSASNETLEHFIEAQEYGTHLLEVWMTATINDTQIETNHIYKDLIWFDADQDDQLPVISCIYRNDYYGNVSIKQYDALSIPYYVYDPTTFFPRVGRYQDDVYIDEERIENNEGVWTFQTGQVGIHTLRLECRGTSLIIKVNVVKLDIDVDPVMSGLQIDFNPIGVSNMSDNRIWTNNNYHMAVSDNFDWVDGGYKTDGSGDSYFLVKSGSSITFDYSMFTGNIENNLTKQYGAEMKICFMIQKVRDVNTVWFTNVDSVATTVIDPDTDMEITKTTDIGIQLSAHQGWLKTNNAKTQDEIQGTETRATNTYLYMPYCEQEIIELDINIDPIQNNNSGVVMSYEDGVPSKAYVYGNTDRFYQSNPKFIKIGSEDCDIRIYRLKIYSRSLTTQEIMRNFIADSRNSITMLNRYNRNCIYYDTENDEYTPYKNKGVLIPEKLAEKVPNVKILMLQTDHFTTSKKEFVKSSLRCIHAPGGTVYPGDPYQDNWYFENGYHAGQGTTSDNYGAAGRNVDFLFNCDGVRKPSDKVNAEAGYVSQVTKGYLTDEAYTESCRDWKGNQGKVALVTSTTQYNSTTSVPNNFFNLKVNIASSENMNNWLLQKRYNDFLPYTSLGKIRDSRVKNDMEFVPAILFIRETNTETIEVDGRTIYSQHKEFNDTDWHFYALGNLGDSKKTDYTRAYDPNDMNEFTIEISDNVKNNATFQTGVYLDSQGHRQIESFTVNNGSASPNVSVLDFEYPITEAEWNNQNNFRHWTLNNEPFDGDHSFEPRYACCGDYRDGKLVNDTTGHGAEQVAKNAQVWKAFYKWVITSSDSQFVNELDQWCVKDAVEFFYAFTHYYTMMDNRAKNTFWHFGKTGQYKRVSRPVPELLHVYCEEGNDNEFIPTTDTSIDTNKTYYTQYAFDLWVYDTDTALGINNNGELIFPYGKEDTDYVVDGNANSGLVFNGARSVFWCRLRDLLQNEIANTFTTVSAQCFNASNLIYQFDTMQECYPEEIWRLDIQRKYLRTFTGESIDNSLKQGDIAGLTKRNTSFLINMMQGRKKYQRKQWVRDQQVYFGTKYLIGNIINDQIIFRTSQGAGSSVAPDYILRIVPFLDMYVSGRYGNTGTLHKRAKAGQLVELDFSSQVTSNQETQIVIYGASKIAELSDLSACYIVANPDFSKAEKLRRLIIGNPTSGYNNSSLTGLTLDNNKMLQELDVRNCTGLAGSLDLSKANNLTKILAENTQLTAVTFATNGKLEIAHLPNTIDTLTMRGLNNLTDFQCSLIYLYNLTLEGGALDGQAIISDTVDTLHELRLYNINWELEDDTILKQMQKLSYSSISGDVYMLSYIGRREKEVYEEKWPDLTIHPNTTLPNGGIIPQYLVQFVNDDENETVLYSKYYNQGEYVEDPFAMQEIEKPTKPKDVEYQYSFGGWLTDGSYIEWSGWTPNGENLQVSTDIKFKAKYASSVRTYTIKWWRYPNDSAGPLQTIANISYGNGYQYNGPRPVRKDEESFLRYYTFKGWDTLTTHITGDTDVYAVWDEFNGTPNTDKDMKDMTPLEIYSVCKNNRQNDYWEARDYFDLFIGKDYYYNNVETITLGKDYLLSSAIARDTYAGNNGYYFNNSNISSSGRNAKVEKTDIRLFTSDIDSFTIAIDFQFGQKPVYTGNYGEEVLLSTFEVNPTGGGGTGEFYNTGFRLLRDSSGVVYLQVGGYRGSNRVQVGSKGQRDIVVITYRTPRIRGVTNYTFDIYSSWFTHNYSSGTSTPSINYRQFTFSTFKSESNEPITLGATSYGVATNGSPLYGDYANGTIHWCKIWKSDLASNDCYDLASWPREKLRMEYYGKEFYEYSYPLDALNQRVKGSWISSGLLGTFNPRRNYYYMSSYSSTYSSSMPRYLLVNRVWRAFPNEWQGIIAQTRVRYYTYTSSTSYYIDDYLFTPSVRDLSSSYNSSPYSVESGGTIPWMTSNFRRIKFYGIQCKDPTKTNYDVYGPTQPTTENHTSYDYYSIWYNPNYSCYYILVPGDMAVQYDLIQNTYSQSNTQGLTANPPAVYQVDLGVMLAGGLWIPAGSYDLRSPSSSSSGYHYAVSTSGSIVSNYYYNYYNSNYANYNGHPVSFSI